MDEDAGDGCCSGGDGGLGGVLHDMFYCAVFDLCNLLCTSV